MLPHSSPPVLALQQALKSISATVSPPIRCIVFSVRNVYALLTPRPAIPAALQPGQSTESPAPANQESKIFVMDNTSHPGLVVRPVAASETKRNRKRKKQRRNARFPNLTMDNFESKPKIRPTSEGKNKGLLDEKDVVSELWYSENNSEDLIEYLISVYHQDMFAGGATRDNLGFLQRFLEQTFSREEEDKAKLTSIFTQVRARIEPPLNASISINAISATDLEPQLQKNKKVLATLRTQYKSTPAGMEKVKLREKITRLEGLCSEIDLAIQEQKAAVPVAKSFAPSGSHTKPELRPQLTLFRDKIAQNDSIHDQISFINKQNSSTVLQQLLVSCTATPVESAIRSRLAAVSKKK